mmetsp:Transcript_34870/g.59048  ORF Transcript_34870/g.59048 Transcript_34870/m.59048 type:complete len:82 (+) Transcript_34870:268-513(+)
MDGSKRGYGSDSKVEEDEKLHWCFQNFNQIPIWLVVHILIFCVILYSSYVCWACGGRGGHCSLDKHRLTVTAPTHRSMDGK